MTRFLTIQNILKYPILRRIKSRNYTKNTSQHEKNSRNNTRKIRSVLPKTLQITINTKGKKEGGMSNELDLTKSKGIDVAPPVTEDSKVSPTRPMTRYEFFKLVISNGGVWRIGTFDSVHVCIPDIRHLPSIKFCMDWHDNPDTDVWRKAEMPCN